MINAPVTRHDTPRIEYHPTIRHAGLCGPRVRCWRPGCRERFGDRPTVELVGGVALFYCHQSRIPADALTIAMLAA